MILDISCQYLGDECKLEGFCVPFGHRVGKLTFLKIYICIGYMMPTIVHVSWIYIILDISCQHLGDECKLEGFCVPGHRVDLPITSDISTKEFHYSPECHNWPKRAPLQMVVKPWMTTLYLLFRILCLIS